MKSCNRNCQNRLPFPESARDVRCFSTCNDDRRIADGRFAEEQVYVLGHEHVPDDNEIIFQPNLFQNGEKTIPSRGEREPRVATITTQGNEVEMSAAIIAFQMNAHGKTVARETGQSL